MKPGPKPAHDNPDSVRMTIGEHLDELRGCVSRSLVALVLACLLCIWPAKYLLVLLARPVVLALQAHGQPNSFLATSPTEPIVIYIKVVVVAGLIVASPYIIRQLWGFVAAGLYRHEREWAFRLVPVSIGLFLVGVVFMYVFVLIVSLNFLIGFGAWLKLPTGGPTALEELLLGGKHHISTSTQPAATSQPAVPFLANDPERPPTGTVWFKCF
jgi:Sec-independent protein secretion pathway component TatC